MKATGMSFQWLDMRITEEKQRREREATAQERLPRAFDELYGHLRACVEAYQSAFGAESAEIRRHEADIQVTVHAERAGQWQQCAQVCVQAVPALPGFRVENGGEPFQIHVGALPGDRLLFKHEEQYLTVELLTRLILDPALFQNLGE
jgi:hypothetical protein